MALLQIRDLTREFKRRGKSFAAVDHVDLDVETGEFIAIVGRSGNGKSTLLNLITGLLKPTSGGVTLSGKVIADLSDREISALRNREFGFVPQQQTLLGNLTVLDNVLLPAELGPKSLGATSDGEAPSLDAAEVSTLASPTQPDPDMPDVIAPAKSDENLPDALTLRARSLLRRLGVDDLAGCYPRELSGGELRRVSIARALMNNPRLLIADEPTGDLDAESTAIAMRLLRETADGGTAVLMVTHDPDALEYADRIYRMDRGKLTEASRG